LHFIHSNVNKLPAINIRCVRICCTEEPGSQRNVCRSRIGDATQLSPGTGLWSCKFTVCRHAALPVRLQVCWAKQVLRSFCPCVSPRKNWEIT